MTVKEPDSLQLFRVALDPDQVILTACSLMMSAAFNNGTARCNTSIVPCSATMAHDCHNLEAL